MSRSFSLTPPLRPTRLTYVARVAVSSLLFLGEGLRRAVELAHEAGVEVFELNYENLSYLNVEYASVLAEFRWALNQAARIGVEVPVAHAPYDDYFALLLGKGLDAAVSEAKLFLDLFGSYGVKYVVFHLFNSKLVGEGRVSWLNKAFFSKLADYAESLGLVVAVENAYKATPWRSVDATAALVKQLNIKSLRMCLDTGHALTNGFDPSEALRKYGDVIAVVHVNDNDGKEDLHLMPGSGRIDWLSMRTELSKLNTMVVMEVKCVVGESPCTSRAVLAKVLGSWLVGE